MVESYTETGRERRLEWGSKYVPEKKSVIKVPNK
jgi:hypothetical protein